MTPAKPGSAAPLQRLASCFFDRKIAAGVLGVLFFTFTAQAVDPSMVAWVEARESGGRNIAGKDGERGVTQLRLCAWQDVNTARKARGATVYPFSAAWNPTVNRLYCLEFLNIQECRLIRYLHRQPTPAEIYRAYRFGFEGFKRRISITNN